MGRRRQLVNHALVITKKELKSYFNSAIAYIVIAVFLLLSGWFFISNIFIAGIPHSRET